MPRLRIPLQDYTPTHPNSQSFHYPTGPPFPTHPDRPPHNERLPSLVSMLHSNPPAPYPVSHVAPAQAATSTSLSSATSESVPQKRPTKAKPNKPAAKRARTMATEAGVGPSIRAPARRPQAEADINTAEHAASSIPANYNNNRPEKSAKPHKEVLTGAADCWALLIGTTHEHRPPDERLVAEAKAAASAHATTDRLSLRRPDSSFGRLLCIPCLNADRWHTWSNTNGGSTHGPRTHFIKEYRIQYMTSCKRIRFDVPLNVLNPEGLEENLNEVINEPVTTEGVARYLVDLIAEQDLSVNIVSSPSFRRLLCYVGQNNITSSKLPGRNMVTRAVAEESERVKEQIKQDMRDAKGRVSITSDLWTDFMERAFMAVTGHYINKDDISTVKVLAFRVIEGSHTGSNVGGALFDVLAEYDILHKIGSITLDNASNNDTLMAELQTRMEVEGYTFDRDGNRVRCTPHVINIAVGAFIDALPESGDEYLAERKKANIRKMALCSQGLHQHQKLVEWVEANWP